VAVTVSTAERLGKLGKAHHPFIADARVACLGFFDAYLFIEPFRGDRASSRARDVAYSLPSFRKAIDKNGH
jgi:hypothetical protein